MSGAEHHATVDKGLKMKIKRKNVNNSKSDAKHEIVKGEKMSSISSESSNSSANGTQVDKMKQTALGDKSPKVKGAHKKEKLKEKVVKGSDISVSSVSTTLDAAFSQVSLDSKPGDSSKPDDPYDFDAKDDENIGFPIKKVKVEKVCTVCPSATPKTFTGFLTFLIKLFKIIFVCLNGNNYAIDARLPIHAVTPFDFLKLFKIFHIKD